jgi:hypothetical protein
MERIDARLRHLTLERRDIDFTRDNARRNEALALDGKVGVLGAQVEKLTHVYRSSAHAYSPQSDLGAGLLPTVSVGTCGSGLACGVY